MPKPNLSSASVDTLLKLRDEIAEILAHGAALLREELSKLGHQIGSKGKIRGSSLKGRKVAVKYRDKSGNTWAGRGAQPRWLREKLATAAEQERECQWIQLKTLRCLERCSFLAACL